MKKLFIVTLLILLLSLSVNAAPKNYLVTLYYPGGSYTWLAKGKPLLDSRNRWYFTDYKTNKLIEITGTVIVQEEEQ